jgi:hypothetical protein
MVFPVNPPAALLGERFTVTLTTHVVVVPHASVEIQVTVVVPTLKTALLRVAMTRTYIWINSSST